MPRSSKSAGQNPPTAKKPLRQRFVEGVKKINDAYDPVPKLKKALGNQQKGYKKATDDQIEKGIKKSGG